MKLLLVTATQAEIGPAITHLQERWQALDANTYMHGNTTVTLCTTGVGMMAATYAVTKALQGADYTFALQAGVGGSFNQGIELGAVVRIAADQYGDLGAEDHDNYLTIHDIGLLQKDEAPFTNGKLVAPEISALASLPAVTGITVNTVSGNAHTIAQRNERYAADVESMEGAAFHYVCLQEGVPFAQVRAISNYVEPRNRAAWKMKDAIINLNKWLIDFLTHAE